MALPRSKYVQEGQDGKRGHPPFYAALSRGRNAGHPAPPAQIRTGATNAYGSYLGCLASNRTCGKG